MASRLLFGSDMAVPEATWKSSDWTASDDRVRGGASKSHIEIPKDGRLARFHGNLDIDTLGGAGFASQRTTGSPNLDLSQFDGIQLMVRHADLKDYTLILKDSVLPKSSSSGREQATISWETTFSAGTNEADEEDLLIQLPWKLFKPTYRGKEVKDVEPLNKSSVMSISIMARSMFGAQQGPFSVTLVSIAAYASEKRESQKAVDDVFPYPYHDQMRFDSFNEKRDPSEIAPKRAHNSFWSTICCSSEQ